jgi:predicted phosphatase
MHVIKNEYTVFFDCDDTLVMHGDHGDIPTVKVRDTVEEKFIVLGVNQPMIRLMKEEHRRGAHITVWSHGGFQWAVNVVEALELTKYVHEVRSKPLTYFDDKSVEEWMTYRVYLEPGSTYKSITSPKGE